ncbi:cytochrome c oxidase subunit 3 [Brumimicrobium mesophilum]|uniref:cytochrome c oxidase subunit 3 n=1 Tax=Brumimicrobium mesophilum TaxID=392717 RepID=UPI000D143C81|nr:cytochrome c oxidase subunit 3 [Brumimicrobium mesophilum]
MKKNFDDSYPKDVQAKVKKNLVWIVCVSISMMFAGFTSAYIVSMGDSFWVKVDLPTAFYISTAFIAISSLVLFGAVKAAKSGNVSRARLMVVTTLFLGIGFGVFQFLGYKALVKSGAHWVTNVIVDDGRYGDYFEIKKDGEYLTVENNQYYLNNKQIEGEDKIELQSFASQFLVPNLSDLKNKNIKYGDFTLLYKSEPLTFLDGEFLRPNGERLEELDFQRLRYLAQNVKDDRADFFMQGEMGKDFKLFYNGNELDYKERTLMYKGKPLSANLQNKLLRGNKDMSTAYFYVITILHLLHVVAGLIMLIVMSVRSYTSENSYKMAISLGAGSVFWHFLGVLWLYLLLFLLFIH